MMWPVPPPAVPFTRRRMQMFIETRDIWIGYYRSDRHHYVCPLPCVVFRWRRR